MKVSKEAELPTCDEKDQMKKSRENVMTSFSKLLCMSSLPANMKRIKKKIAEKM